MPDRALAAVGRTAQAGRVVSPFTGNERCAGRVDGRPEQTDTDDNVPSIAER